MGWILGEDRIALRTDTVTALWFETVVSSNENMTHFVGANSITTSRLKTLTPAQSATPGLLGQLVHDVTKAMQAAGPNDYIIMQEWEISDLIRMLKRKSDCVKPPISPESSEQNFCPPTC